MFLLVSGRHVGAHTDEHQHGVSIQISINLGKKFLRISRTRKIAVTRILARVFAYLPSFISQILDFIYWPVLIVILIYFELRDTENQHIVLQIHDGRLKFQPIRNWVGIMWRHQDGGAHESAAMLENSSLASTEDWDRSYRFPWRHKSCQGHARMSRNFKIDTYSVLWS